MNKPEFTFGDLVSVAGYYPRLFKVDGYREEHYYYPNEQWSEIVYELYDAHTSDWLEADEDDLELIAPADSADDYLVVNPPHYEEQASGKPEWMTFVFGGDASMKPKEPRKPTARELSAKEAEERKKARKARTVAIDRLLDELNDYKRLAAEFGDEEYKARVEYVTLKLTELTE